MDKRIKIGGFVVCCLLVSLGIQEQFSWAMIEYAFVLAVLGSLTYGLWKMAYCFLQMVRFGLAVIQYSENHRRPQ